MVHYVPKGGDDMARYGKKKKHKHNRGSMLGITLVVVMLVLKNNSSTAISAG